MGSTSVWWQASIAQPADIRFAPLFLRLSVAIAQRLQTIDQQCLAAKHYRIRSRPISGIAASGIISCSWSVNIKVLFSTGFNCGDFA